MTSEQAVDLWNIVVDMIQQQIAEVGEEAEKPEYWTKFLAKDARAASIYSEIAQELIYMRAMAPTLKESGAESIVFDGDDYSVHVDLTTFKKTLEEKVK